MENLRFHHCFKTTLGIFFPKVPGSGLGLFTKIGPELLMKRTSIGPTEMIQCRLITNDQKISNENSQLLVVIQSWNCINFTNDLNRSL